MASPLKITDENLLWSLLYFFKTAVISGQRLEDRYTGFRGVVGYPEKLETFQPPLIAVDVMREEEDGTLFYGQPEYGIRIITNLYLFAGSASLEHDRQKKKERAQIASDIKAILMNDGTDTGEIVIDVFEENDLSDKVGEVEVASLRQTNLDPTGVRDIERFRTNFVLELSALQGIG